MRARRQSRVSVPGTDLTAQANSGYAEEFPSSAEEFAVRCPPSMGHCAVWPDSLGLGGRTGGRTLALALCEGAPMLPREHGVYGQLVFPLATALTIAHAGSSSVLTATAAIALFLAHEPLVVLLGHRGRREQMRHAGRAWWMLMGVLVVATASGLLAFDGVAPGLRWTFLAPVLPGMAVVAAIIRGRERTMLAEAGVAVSCAAVALPVCAGAGNAAAGAVIAAAFALLFVLGTLAVRVIVLRIRGGGDQGASGRTRALTFGLATLGALVAIAAAGDGAVAWATVGAMLPGVVFTSGLAAFPPHAARLKRVGWSLVAVSAVTALLLVAVV